MTVTHPGHLLFMIFMSQHACTILLYIIYHPDYYCYCCYFQFSILPTYCSYYFNALIILLLYVHILSSTVLFPLCTLAGLILTDLYYFSVPRSESQYRELFIDPIMIQPYFGELVSLSWLVLFRCNGSYCWWFCISYMCFCNAPILWVRRRYCDVYTQVRNTLMYIR